MLIFFLGFGIWDLVNKLRFRTWKTMERECNELKAAMRIAQSRQQALSLAALKTKEKASKSISSPRKKAESLQTLKDHNEHHLIEISRLTEELQHSR